MKLACKCGLAFVCGCIVMGLVYGQTTYTWNLAGNGKWDVPANWDPNTGYPQAGDTAKFSAGTGRTIYIEGNQACDTVVVTNAGAWTWTGSPTNLTVSTLFNYSGTGNSTFRAVLAGTCRVEKNVGTSSPLTLSGTNTYSGDTIINAGYLYVGSSSDAYPPTKGPVGTGTLILKNGTGVSTATTTGRTIHNPITIDGNVRIGGGGTSQYIPTLSGPITITGQRTITFEGAANGDINSNIGDGGNGYTLTIAGAASINIRGQSTYGGGTILNRTGATRVGSSPTGDPPTSGPFGTGTVSLVGVRLMTEGNTSRTLSNTFSLDGNGVTLGADTTHYGELFFTRPIILTGDRILTMSQNTSHYIEFQNGITDNGKNYTLTLRGYSGWLQVAGTTTVDRIRVWNALYTLMPNSTCNAVMNLEDNQAYLRCNNTSSQGGTGPHLVFKKASPWVWLKGNGGGVWTVQSLTRGEGRPILNIGGHREVNMGPPGPLGPDDKFKVVNNPPTPENDMVAPYFIEQTADFLTYDGAGNGFKRVTYDYINNINAGGPTDIHKIQNAGQSLTADREIWALRCELNGLGGSGYTLTLGSGGLSVRTGTSAAPVIDPNLAFGPSGNRKEGLIFAGISSSTYDNQNLVLNGSLITTNGLTVSGWTTGAVVLNGDSSATLSGPITVNGTRLRLGVTNALPDSLNIRLNAGTFDLNGFSKAVSNLVVAAGTLASTAGPATLSLNGDLTYDGTGATGAGPVFPGRVTLNLTGQRTFSIGDGYATVDLSINGPLAGSNGYVKEGDGWLRLNATNAVSLTGPIVVKAGVLAGRANANGQHPFGSAASPINLYNGGDLRLDTGGNTETNGVVTYYGGNVIQCSAGSSGPTWRFADWTRGSRGTLVLSGDWTSSAYNNHFDINHTIRVAAWGTQSLLPAYLVGVYNLTDNNVGRHLRYDASGRVKSHNYNKTDINSASATETVDVSTAQSLTADRSCRFLRTSAAIGNSGGNWTLTIAGSSSLLAGLIVNGNNTISPDLKFGANGDIEGLIWVQYQRTATLDGTITTTGGLTKFGLGTLRLNKASSYSGGTYGWSGTLQIADAGAIGASPLVLGHEGTLDLAGSYTLNNDISGDGRITTGANTLTLGPNGSLSPGFSVGTLTVGNLDFRGTLYWEFDATNSTDVVACETLTFGGSAAKKVHASWLGTGEAPLGTYTLFTYTGADPTVVPSEWAVLAPPKRAGSVSVDAANKRVVLTLTRLPEGSMLMVR